jgi:uncharacterized membrane protein
MQSLRAELEKWLGPIEILMSLTGLALTVIALINLSQSQSRSKSAPLFTLLSGILLLNAPALIEILGRTFFGPSAALALSYKTPQALSSKLVSLALLIVALIGLIGVFRGLYLLKSLADERGVLARATIHLIGGTLCLNAEEFIKVLSLSLGGALDGLIGLALG